MGFNWGNAFRGGASGAVAGNSILPGWGAAIGGGIGALGGLFGGDDDEERDTNKLLDQIPDQLRQYLMPYIKGGENALPHLNDISGEYANEYKDPNSIISRIGAGYRESPGYKWRLGQGENAITNAAAAGGMAGTGQHQQQAGELAGHLADQDFNDYMERALGLRREGLVGRTGIEQDIYGRGAGAAGDLGTGLSNYLFARAGLNRQRASEENKSNSDMFSNILSFLKK